MKTMLVLGALAGGLASCGTAGAATPNPTGLSVPSGFKVSVYASGLKNPRLMALSGSDLFVSDTGTNSVYVLRAGKDGKPVTSTYASNLNEPHGLAFHGGYLYVANTDSVVRFKYASGDLKASGVPEKLVTLPSGAGHSTRTVVFGPDDKMYVATGSSCNVCEETDPKRASVWVYDADGKNGKAYATGLRNPVGLAWYGGNLYATTNGRDNLGDDIPPESMYKLQAGGFYGWPYCIATAAGQPMAFDKDFGKKDASVCKSALPPIATTTAHAAPLGFSFYSSKTFPAAYQGKMFVALHGSWNRSQKSGDKVVMVDPATGKVTDFLTGFLKGQNFTGRPASTLALPDGSLAVTDDQNGVIYRVSYGQ